MICGVYAIRNKINGKCYVGQSANIGVRFGQHFSALKRGNHHCEYLQRAFSKYGEESFENVVLENCTFELLTQQEQYWIDHLRLAGIYNSAPAAGSPLGIKRSVASKEKMSLAKKGKRISEETRERMRVAQAKIKDLKRANALLQWSDPVAIEAISKVRKGRIVSDTTKEKLRLGLLNRWQNEEYKSRVSASSKAAQLKLSDHASERMKKKWSDPEFRSSMLSARNKARHQIVMQT